MATWSAFALFGLLVRSASSQLTPWDNQLFDFGWTPYDPTLIRCSGIPIAWQDRTTANPASTSPYTVLAFQGGHQPIVIGTASSRAYNWTVGLPTGGPYILSMRDANGYTGGTSLVFNVADGAGPTCDTPSPYTANSLQVTSTGTNAQCSSIVVKVDGGSAPYTMKIIAGERPPKTTTWTTSTMSYTIDMKPTEQFFVWVTDANGLTAVDGIHSVTSGDSACFDVATTVRVGAEATTLSYDPSSTVSLPTSSSSSSVSSSSSRVIQNTYTTTMVTVVTQGDGSSATYTLPPGSSTVIPNKPTAEPSTDKQLPAIIGGAVGGAALLVIAFIVFLWHRRRSVRVMYGGDDRAHDKQPFSPVGPQAMPFGAHHISPYTPPTPGRDTAPLMAHMNSMYTSSGGSATTPAPSTPGMSYFGQPGQATSPGYQDDAPAWAIPAVQRHGSVDATNYTASSSDPASGMASPSSREGIPPGAMAPQLKVGGRPVEKATFMPSRPGVVAPPPYSQGG